MEGIIIKNQSNDYTVKTEKGVCVCKPRGKFRIQGLIPLVGDNVEIDDINKYILNIKPRKNSLIRPSIANVDVAVLATSVKEPNFDSNLLDKLLSIIEYNNIKPIICLTKVDLLNYEERKNIEKITNYYEKIGYEVINNTEIKRLKELIKGKTVVIAGQSGAGKSSLLNKLDNNLNLQTNEISKALGRGKHTTRCVTLYEVEDSLIADTPGFSSVDFRNMSKIDIRDNMREMFNNLEKCKYRDCMHIMEEGCEVKKLVQSDEILKSRYENYKSFIGGK